MATAEITRVLNIEGDIVGIRGARGYSAYEVAVQEGYVGTEEEWLASLKGDTGEKGEKGDQGIQGIQGEHGIQGIQGDKGDKGDTGASAYSYTDPNHDGHIVITEVDD